MEHNSTPFIDIHTHKEQQEGNENTNILSIQNIFIHELEAERPSSYFSVGWHPWELDKYKSKIDWSVLENQLVENKKLIAIGESGLDKVISTNLEFQKEVFLKHIQLSEKYQKPLIIHCVKAYSEILEIRKSSKAKMPWVLHGFNANIQIVKQCLQKGLIPSFGAFLFHEKTKAFKVFTELKSELFFLETDDQEIYSIQDIYRQASLLQDKKLIDLKDEMYQNFKSVFKV